jgi:hypothetical protein
MNHELVSHDEEQLTPKIATHGDASGGRVDGSAAKCEQRVETSIFILLYSTVYRFAHFVSCMIKKATDASRQNDDSQRSIQ